MKATVNKADYQVVKMNGGQFAIELIQAPHTIIFGGDSANEDDYNEDYINDVFANWNGELDENGKI
jgi:hypothetical protein